MTTIPLWVAQSLSLAPSTARPAANVTTAQGVVTVPLFTLPRLEALGQQATNLDVLALNLPSAAAARLARS
jgi:hypothetical protein